MGIEMKNGLRPAGRPSPNMYFSAASFERSSFTRLSNLVFTITVREKSRSTCCTMGRDEVLAHSTVDCSRQTMMRFLGSCAPIEFAQDSTCGHTMMRLTIS